MSRSGKSGSVARYIASATLVCVGVSALYYALEISDRFRPSKETPDIEIDAITVSALANELGTMNGHVTGLRHPERYKVVIYAHTNHWYVQPFTEQPLTEILPNGSWSNSTHRGDAYAAFVVSSTWRPVETVNALPVTGGDILGFTRQTAPAPAGGVTQ